MIIKHVKKFSEKIAIGEPQNYLLKIDKLPGYLRLVDGFLIDFLLNYYKDKTGNYLEIGSYLGKTLGILIKNSSPNETVYSLDLKDYGHAIRTNLSFLENIENLKFIKDKSDNILNHNIKDIKFLHIDGCHSFDATYNDLCNSTVYTNDHCIIVLDDFVFNEYTGNVIAYFKALYTGKINYIPFMSSDRKLYLCNKSVHEELLKYVKENISAAFVKSYIKNIALNISEQKTDSYNMLCLSTERGYADECDYIKKLL